MLCPCRPPQMITVLHRQGTPVHRGGGAEKQNQYSPRFLQAQSPLSWHVLYLWVSVCSVKERRECFLRGAWEIK